MKVLGATRARIAGIFAWEFAALGLATALAALGVGTLGGLSGGAPPDGPRLDLPARWSRSAVASGRHGAHPGLRPGWHSGGAAAAAAWLCYATNEAEIYLP